MVIQSYTLASGVTVLRAALISATALFLLACALPISGQQAASDCRPVDDSAQGLLTYARMLAAPRTDALVRTAQAYQIPAATAEAVALVKDDPVLCRRAARSYAAELDERGPLARRVHVVQIGLDRADVRYLVTDPDHRMGGYEVVIVFDHRFHALASFTR